MKQLFANLLLFFFSSLSLHAQSFDWVRGGGSTTAISSSMGNSEDIYSMCTDANGNVYTLSVMGETVITADTFYRAGAFGSYQNVFFTSHTCDGQMRFAKLISCNEAEPCSVVCDTLGHVYVALAAFHGTSSTTLLRLGYDTTISGFTSTRRALIQYDTSGHLNWIRFVGENVTATAAGTGGGRGSFALMDGNNNVHFINIMKFGVPITPSITSHWGNYDLMYDASGTLLSVKKLDIDSSLIMMEGGAIDKSTNKLYVYGTRHLGVAPDSSVHPYVAEFDTARNLVWKDTLASPFFPGAGAFASITTDNAGHLYITGAGPRQMVFGTDTVTNVLSTIGYYVSFVMKTDTDGNVKWMKGFSANTSVNNPQSITLTSNGNVAAAGVMAGKIVNGTHTVNTYTGEGQNSWFVVIDTAGFVDSIYQLHGPGFYDKATRIVSDRTGNLYIGGKVESTTWAGSLTPYTSVGGNSDYYIMKYGVDCDCTSMPTAAFIHSGTAVHSFTFTGTTTPTIDSVRWDFGDGGTSTLMNPTHTYTAGDTFTACVRVYTPCGNDLYCIDIIIPCVSAPTSSFSMSGTGLTRTFTYTGSTTGLTGSVTWSFTGGTGPTSGTPVSHVFPSAGSYTVCVTATNACGTTTTCTPVTVSCTSSPVSAYTFSGTGLTRTFTYTGTTAGLDSVTWTFSDGGTATGLSTPHTFAAAGTYTVCAKVYTNCGSHTFCSPVTITCVSLPTASFTYSGTGATISFVFTGTTAGMDSVRWDFGDGGTSTVLTPSHTFAIEDTFHVCVRIYTNCGTNMSCQDVIITCLSPVTSAFVDTGNLVHGFGYTGTMAGYDSVRWNYGDGNSDTGLVRIHTYATAGTYTVCAKVHTDCGTHTYCRTIVISGTGAVSSVSFANIKVYPNPSKEELYVTGVTQETDYRLLNIVGITMQRGKLQAGDNTLPLQQMLSGIYVLEMSAMDGQKKVVRIVRE